MIDEFKELVAVINSLPQLALWVAIGFWTYKVFIIGSIYGVIRLVVQKGYDAFTSPKRQQIEVAIDEVVYYTSKNRLIGELKRIVPPGPQGSAQSNTCIEWLSEAITAKMEKDGPPKK